MNGRRAIVDASSGQPTEVVAGLGLLARCVLVLRKAGFSRVAVLGARDPDGVRRSLDRALSSRGIEQVVDFADRLGALGLDRDGDDGIVVWPCDTLADPALVRRLGDTSLDDVDVCYAVSDAEPRPLGPLVARGAWLASLEDRPVLEQLAAGRARALDATDLWFARVTSADGKRHAVKELFDACRKPVDGLVSRHLNRHVSIAISKRLVDTPITPNQVSAVTFALGVLGAYFVSRGGYLPTVAGAFFLQWNSILDGVDGELARVRHQQSKLGQWVDTISDDATNVLFWGSLGWGARTLPSVGPYLAWCGAIASVSNALVAIIYYVELVSIGSGDFYDIQWGVDDKPAVTLKDRLLLFFRYVLKKDFFILLCLVLALLGVLPLALPVLAAAGAGLLVAASSRAIRVMRGRTARARA